MAQADILREFLVKLGYKVDEASQRRFAEGVERMTDRVKDLSKAALVMGTAVGVAVVKVASDLDGLYFASKRIGASAGNVRAFEYAVKQMGGSGESARAALEGLARFMRNSPGAESFIQSITGKSLRDKNGNLRDTVQIYTELAGALKGMDSAQANAVAQVLGLDDNTLQAIRSGDLKGYMADYLATLDKLGIKQDEAAESAAKFSRGLEEVKTIAGLLVEKYSIKLIDFFKQLGERIVNVSDAVSETPFGTIWADEIDILSGYLKTVVGWLEKAWGFIKLISGVAWDSWKEKISGLMGGSDAGGFVGMMAAKVAASFGGQDALAALRTNGDIAGGPNALGAVGSGAAVATDKRARGIRNNNPGNIEYGDFAKRMGATGSDGRFAIFPTPEAGLRAMSELLGAYARRGINSARDIVNRWAPASENNVGAYSSALANALGVSPDAMLNMSDPSTIANLMGAITMHENGSNPYGRELMLKTAGSGRVQQSNTTTIHVNGSSDPMATAQAVASLQVQTAQDMTRNLRGAMQ